MTCLKPTLPTSGTVPVLLMLPSNALTCLAFEQGASAVTPKPGHNASGAGIGLAAEGAMSRSDAGEIEYASWMPDPGAIEIASWNVHMQTGVQ